MSNNTISTLTRRTAPTVNKQKYFVYYNKWTGAIKSISTKLDFDTGYEFFQSNDTRLSDILKGKSSEQDFYVVFDNEINELIIVDKLQDEIKLSSDTNFNILEKFKDSAIIPESDLRLIFNTDEKTLTLIVNQKVFSNFTHGSESFKSDSISGLKLNLMIVGDIDPDHLKFYQESIEIDVDQALTCGQVIDIPDYITEFDNFLISNSFRRNILIITKTSNKKLNLFQSRGLQPLFNDTLHVDYEMVELDGIVMLVKNVRKALKHYPRVWNFYAIKNNDPDQLTGKTKIIGLTSNSNIRINKFFNDSDTIIHDSDLITIGKRTTDE